MDDEVGKELEKADSAIPVSTRAEMATAIQVLAEQGFGRNEISRRTGISTFLVSTIAEEIGVSFDRSRIEQALRARLTDLRLAQMGIAEGLSEDLTFARLMLRTAKDRRDLAFAAKTISDLARAAGTLTPEASEADSLEATADWLVDFRNTLGKVREEFEQQHGVAFDSDEARQIIEQQEETPNGESQIP
ncbi:hypothetical protein [Streptomyces phaeochromogenes]|uniref:hypothetical protein n=1 Tax=Streptomyces phaeochromogenes TaxID=1923 RepID=UPI0036D02564